MLFGNLTLAQILANAVALLVAITIHEFSHAWLASRLGDQTARSQGRLSLNPVAHLDLVGTILLLTAGFGWGKPVPVNPYNLRNGPRAGMALTSLAGPASNLLLAFVFAIPFRLGVLPITMQMNSNLVPSPSGLLLTILIMNVTLAFFNLIPLPPLDGFSVALGILPTTIAHKVAGIARYGPLVLFGILLLGPLVGFNLFGIIVSPVVEFFLRNVYLGL